MRVGAVGCHAGQFSTLACMHEKLRLPGDGADITTGERCAELDRLFMGDAVTMVGAEPRGVCVWGK